MSITIQFAVFTKPEPQGSMKAFMRKGMRYPVVTSDNKDLKSFRQEVSIMAMKAVGGVMPFAQHVPVKLSMDFFMAKPQSAPKKRTCMVVRPDLDKLCRSIFDSLAGIVFFNDAQVVQIEATKYYELPERVEIEVSSFVLKEGER